MNMRKKKSTLKDLIDSIDWVGIEVYRHANKLQDNEIWVYFKNESKKTEYADKIYIRFGREVLNRLGWEPGDMIYPAFHQDDHLCYMLVKVESQSGYTLTRESKANSSRLCFKLRNNPLQKETKTFPVNYEIHKKKLIFRAVPIKNEE
jgi:hypothetical protein